MKKDQAVEEQNYHLLRQRAEQALKMQKNADAVVVDGVTPLQMQRLIQELQIHEIELQMQNEELKRTRDEAEAERERYHDLYDFAPVGYFSLTEEGIIREANLAGARLFQTERSWLIGNRFGNFVSYDDIGVFQEFLKKVFKEEGKATCTVSLKKQGEPIRHVQIEAASAGDERLCLAVVMDVTDRKNAEDQLLKLRAELEEQVARRTEQLQKSEEHFRLVYSTSPDSININRLSDGLYVDINDGFTRLTGFTREDVIGRSSFDIGIWRHPDDRQKLLAELKENGHYENLEAEFRRKDGSIITGLMSAKIIFLQNEPHLLSITRDISDRKRAEEEKAKLQLQLVQAQKMESIGRLAGGVAHDFNNMLGVIIGHLEIAMDQVHPSNPLYADLATIRKAADRSADLTRQLLAFARKQTVSPRVQDLNQTVSGMLKMLRRIIGEDIQLVWKPGADLWPVKIDPSQIDQILANLSVNARDAIDGVGKLIIETKKIRIDESTADGPGDVIPGDYILLSVTDSGCGMSADVLNKIFEPFFTTKGVGQGTGLGLAMIYGIVKQNSGFIYVESKPDEGTTFRIYLPRYTGKIEETKAGEDREKIPGGTETVLVVEDEPAMLNLCRLILEKQGYRVLCSAMPAQAMQLAEKHEGEIHLLIVDVIMPEMNGRDLSRKIASIHPDTQCLFMSGYTSDVMTRKGLLADGVHFIQKPFTQKALTSKVREILDLKKKNP